MNKQELNKSYYQNHKETIKARRQARYQAQKQQTQEQANTLYQAHNIKVLLSLKDYTELTKDKCKLWSDFCWTFKDLNEDGFYDIVQIMKLEQVANNLIKDYWTTAKSQLTKQSQNWNTLTEEEQTKLIKYWAREKARKEKRFANSCSALETQGKDYEKEQELAKFHEERGKLKCECWSCQASKERQSQIKQDFWNSLPNTEREVCPECGKLVKTLDEENGLCRKCLANYE